MPVDIQNRDGFVAQSLVAVTSAGEGNRVVASSPCSNWALQVVTGSTTAIVTLGLGLASSSTAVLTTAITWASSAGQTSGTTLYSTAALTARVAAANLTAGASSGGANAWIAGL